VEVRLWVLVVAIEVAWGEVDMMVEEEVDMEVEEVEVASAIVMVVVEVVSEEAAVSSPEAAVTSHHAAVVITAGEVASAFKMAVVVVTAAALLAAVVAITIEVLRVTAEAEAMHQEAAEEATVQAVTNPEAIWSRSLHVIAVMKVGMDDVMMDTNRETDLPEVSRGSMRMVVAMVGMMIRGSRGDMIRSEYYGR
jgi:hypothetical protein